MSSVDPMTAELSGENSACGPEELCNALLPTESFASSKECKRLLNRAHSSGLWGGIPDLLILADVLRYSARLFTYDEKIIKLARRLG